MRIPFFDKIKPDDNEKKCPYDGLAYNKVPGYIAGHGCPFCGGISFHHVPVPKSKEIINPNRGIEKRKA